MGGPAPEAILRPRWQCRSIPTSLKCHERGLLQKPASCLGTSVSGPDADVPFKTTSGRPPPGGRFYLRRENSLAGVFEVLGNLPADRQFDVAVDTYVDDHRAVFDR